MSKRTQTTELGDILLRMLDAIPEPIIAKNKDGKFVFANKQVTDMYQTSLEEILGKEDHHFTGDIALSEKYKRSCREVINSGKNQVLYEKAIDTVTGILHHYEAIKAPFKDDVGEDYVAILGKDITNISLEKEAADKNLDRLAHILSVSKEGVWDYDVATDKFYHNRQWEIITGIDKSENTFTEFQNRVLESDKDIVFDAIQSLVEENAPYDIEYRIVRDNDNEVIWIWDRGKTVEKDESGKPLRLVGLIQDITEKKLNQIKVENLAFYDVLTKLPNRALFNDRLAQSIAQVNRLNIYGAVLLLDLDYFKQLNDTYGHLAGDTLLVEVSKRLKQCLLKSDTVARLGGDEFILLLTNLATDFESSAEMVNNISLKIRQAITKPFELALAEGQRTISYSVTVSIGIALFSPNTSDSNMVLRIADAALYKAKESGRNNSVIFDPNMEDTIKSNIKIERLITDGLQKDNFILHYQKQCNAQGEVFGYEALLRTTNVSLSEFSPFNIISVAEETNQIMELGNAVFEHACQTLLQWKDKQCKSIRLAVNCSPKQILQRDFVEIILAFIERTGIDATQLKIEITESVLLKDMQGTAKKLSRLRDAGLSICLDDFGTGYSSLAYLKNLPIDEIKIDRSFITNIIDCASDLAMVKAIISLGDSFGVDVIAEGVETDTQLKILSDLGCKKFQGFLFSKPLPLESLPFE